MDGARTDVDNLAKLAKDALTAGRFYNDDAQVVSLTAVKRYARTGEEACTLVDLVSRSLCRSRSGQSMRSSSDTLLRRAWIATSERAGIPRPVAMKHTGHEDVKVFDGYGRNAVGDDTHDAVRKVHERRQQYRRSRPSPEAPLTGSLTEPGQWPGA